MRTVCEERKNDLLLSNVEIVAATNSTAFLVSAASLQYFSSDQF